ncbi:hypothetical protein ACIBEA_41750 [Streptomyces sp. NPDC051555]|uniref:hypothetical protein n=1 Tax=Streptomyces sp. NPDC051555 TaxID=3365657 RepID=UPI0037B1EA30
MFRIVRSVVYAVLHTELDQARADLDQAHTDLDRIRADLDQAYTDLIEARNEQIRALIDAGTASDSAIRAEGAVETLRAALGRATADTARAEGELHALRPELLLDTEDRAALRKLVHIARKQTARATRVYALFHQGALHSVHASVEAAESAAEAEGAPPDGWTAYTPGSGVPGAAEVVWRVQPLPLGGAA